MTQQQLYQYIDDYRTGRLSPTQKAAFEDRLTHDPDFKEMVEQDRAAGRLIELEYAYDLSAMLKTQNAARKQNQKLKRIGGVLAGVVLLAGLGFLFDFGPSDAVKWPPKTAEEMPRTTPQQNSLEDTLPGTKPKATVPNLAERPTPEPKTNKPTVNSPLPAAVPKIETPEHEALPILLPKPAAPKSKGIADSLIPISAPRAATLASADSNDSSVVPINPKQKTDCQSLLPIEVGSQKSSMGQMDGKLLFPNAQGFEYVVEGYGSFMGQDQLTGLAAGEYRVRAQYLDQCTFELEPIRVEQEPCLKRKNLVFNITYETELIVPIVPQNQTKITIFNRQGELVRTDHVGHTDQYRWSGQLSNGRMADVGSYLLMMNQNETNACEYFVVVAQ